MDLASISDALGRSGFEHPMIQSDGDVVTVVFTDVGHARSLAGLLLAEGIPRQFLNNVVDARVKFGRSFQDRVVEVLRSK